MITLFLTNNKKKKKNGGEWLALLVAELRPKNLWRRNITTCIDPEMCMATCKQPRKRKLWTSWNYRPWTEKEQENKNQVAHQAGGYASHRSGNQCKQTQNPVTSGCAMYDSGSLGVSGTYLLLEISKGRKSNFSTQCWNTILIYIVTPIVCLPHVLLLIYLSIVT